MSDIILHKVNEAFIKIDAESSTLRELSEYFTFYAPNYRFHPLYKQKRWDGKIRLLNWKTNQIYYGLKESVKKFASERGYSVTQKFEDYNREFALNEAMSFIDKLNISLPENGKPRDYQVKALVESVRYNRRFLKSPTASGKSLIAYLMSRFFMSEGKVGLVIVPTINLVEQLYTDFVEYSTKNGWKVDKYCHRVHAKYEKTTDKPITISTWQSLIKLPKEYFEKFDYVILDEAHGATAKSLVALMTQCVNAKIRIGMTGTTDDLEVHDLVLLGLFGEVKELAKTIDLINKKQLAQFQIKNLVLKYDEKSCIINQKVKYEDELRFIMANQSRNRFIKNLALSLEGNTLILFRRIEKHGKPLYDLINNNGKKNCYFIYGGTDVDDRETIRKIMEKEKDAILLASEGTFSKGSNIRNLHNLIFASPSKAKIKTLQSIGRVLRLSSQKEIATLFDIVDDLRCGKRMNYALKHFENRLKIYIKEKFPYKTYNIELKNT